MRARLWAAAALATGVLLASATGTASAAVLDFEAPLPSGLSPMTFWQGTVVPSTARVTDQYLSLGIRFSGAALVTFGSWVVVSGVNALAGIASDGTIDYDQPVTFSFFMPGNGSVAGTTDFFAYSPDVAGYSGNVITISAFGLDGSLLGQTQYVETGNFMSPLSISGIGQFHRVTIDQTLYDRTSGGIALDLVQFGAISAASAPEPGTLALLGLGVAGLVATRRRKQHSRDICGGLHSQQ